MAIRPRGEALQIDVTLTRAKADGSGKEQVRYREDFHGTMQEARAREATISAALKNYTEAPAIKSLPGAAKLTLKEALDATHARYWATGGQSRTVLSNMAVCVEHFGASKPIGDITTEDADAFIVWMKNAKGYSPATVRQKVATMTKMLRHYHKRGHIKAMPVFETDPIGDNLRDRVITRAEEATLLELLRTRYDVAVARRSDGITATDAHALVVLLMDTGARPSELRKVEARSLRGGLLTIRGVATDEDGTRRKASKTGRTRTIPLTRRALNAFEQMVAAHGDNPLAWATPGALRHAWDWARGEMGLADDEGFIPYACRHTCATRLYELTRDIILVKDWLGHTDIKMTMRYAKLMPGALEAARDKLEGPVLVTSQALAA